MFRLLSVLALLACLSWMPTRCAAANYCYLPMEVGDCEAFSKRFFYNKMSQKCEEFKYGGCGGNDNNFKSLVECQTECTNICSLPKKEGPCEAAIPAYYFDTKSGTCQMFYFGGCEANANNFRTKDKCMRKCPKFNDICLAPEDSGESTGEYDVRWRYDYEKWSCVPFVYYGEGGNMNKFMTRDECMSNCPIGDICLLRPDPGPCEVNEDKWHYDAVSGECREFKYGGCLGNENRFKSKAACHLRCPKKSICSLPKAGEYSDDNDVEKSRKEGAQPLERFYYDAERETCRYFKYSGSGGNENNFMTVEKCKLNCPVMSKCAKRRDRGSSNKYTLKWYYDVETQKCKDFIYFGEGGNNNKFETKRGCQDDCGGCKQKKDRGPCHAFYTRWYYDSETRTCKTFVFGGCRANSNNHKSLEECIDACVS